ncbi:BTAD domain-containing putative transcriptional regulator [Kitasatospora nipponensis]|uniref:BTAD domain-containing putative transcriptional regulator n=1 Tax=Kitasatospora nipponensis TaxID=258049 RepID=A0ABN1WJ07_9ACTN
MDFRLLGQLEVRDEDGSLCRVPDGRLRTLLAALLMHAGEVVSADALAEYVWETALPRRPREALQVMVVRLRKSLGPQIGGRLRTVRPGYLFAAEPAELDLRRFEELSRRGLAAGAAQDWRAARDLLERALACWRGEALQGVPGELLALESGAVLQERRLDALRGRIAADLALGGHERVVGELAGLVERWPLREQFRCQLVLALYRTGRRADALAGYQEGRRLLVGELGIEPGVELQALHRAVLADDPALAWVAPAEAAVPAASPGPADPAVPAGGNPPAPSRPAQLPPDLPDFTGRAEQTSRLVGLLAPGGTGLADGSVTGAAPATGGTVVLCALSGAGGIGKTTLAVHAAHLVRTRFGDGQLYADLQGTKPVAVDPAEVQARFLRGLGLVTDAIPADPEERAALYRTVLAERQVLILLDDARDAAQVRPLLPGSGPSAALVTSRGPLAGVDGVHRMLLEVLGADEARVLIDRVTGGRLVAAEPRASAEVLRLCAGLPLAIRIAGARLATEPGLTVQELAVRLADQRGRLDELEVEDRAVRASFAVGYAALPAHAARAFRLLALVPGPTFTEPAVRALLGCTAPEAALALRVPQAGHLLERPAPDRYRFHDLLRVYAAERVAAEQPEPEQRAAVDRLLAWYLHSSAAVSRQLHPQRRPVPLDGPPPPDPVAAFADYAAALAWGDAEQQNLVAAVRLAAATGRHRSAWQLPMTMWSVCQVRSAWADWISTHELALAAAEQLGDDAAQGWILNCLSPAYQGVQRNAEAIACIQRSLDIRLRLGDRLGASGCLLNLGFVHGELGDLVEADRCTREALAITRENEDRPGTASALLNLGEVARRRAAFPEAAEHLRAALAIYQEVGHRLGESKALANLATVLGRLGSVDEAGELAESALTLCRATGNRFDEAAALRTLAAVALAHGRAGEAVAHLRAGYAILLALGAPEAAELAEQLAELERPQQPE